MSSVPAVDLQSRWALTFAEAAAALAISESTLRRIRPQLDEVAAVVYVGQSPRITTAGLTRYVEQLEAIARQQLADAKAEGESILRCLSEKR